MGIHALITVHFKRVVEKPMPISYPKNPKTVGEHLRKKRMELKLLQSDLAKILGVSTDCVTYWENNRSKPQIQHYPAIQLFLGYSLVKVNEKKFEGRLRAYRWRKGLSHKRLGEMLGVDASTVGSWEKGESFPSAGNLKELESLFKM